MVSSRRNPAARQADLASQLNNAGFMSVGDLAVATGVSEITVRRDLAVLERTGAVRRTHGGAIGLRRADASAFDAFEPSFEARRRRNGAAKTRIARAAERLIEPGQSLALDTGTTTFELGRLVGRIADLQIVTNSTRIAGLLADNPNPVYLPAGRVRGRELSIYGKRAVESLQDYSFDIFFLGVSGLTADGLFDYSPEDTEVKRAFIDRSSKVVVLCDSAKFNRVAMVCVAKPSEIHAVVCDRPPPDPLGETLRRAGVELVCD
ncbi:MAG: DeoR/GlpR transcriptional regulator [Hyphomicrobiales bacterium]|nr:DeoR/GlpR transcriptional regulator [Hyphomicrobiales bacterium]